MLNNNNGNNNNNNKWIFTTKIMHLTKIIISTTKIFHFITLILTLISTIANIFPTVFLVGIFLTLIYFFFLLHCLKIIFFLKIWFSFSYTIIITKKKVKKLLFSSNQKLKSKSSRWIDPRCTSWFSLPLSPQID